MMILLKKYKLIVILLFVVQKFFAQQDPQFTQYMHNTFVVNPAFAGSLDKAVIVGLARSQWVGIEGAPNTQTLSFNAPMPSVKNAGFGINIMNDAIGPLNEVYFDGSVSYAIHLQNETRLAFGLKLGGRYFSVDPNKINLDNPNDPKALQNINKLFATVGAGLYFNAERYYLGISIPNLIPSDIYEGSISTGTLAKERYHIFTMAGYAFDVTENIRFKPATLLKIVSGAPISLDVSANFLFVERFQAGVSIRLDDSISGSLGMQINDNFYIGYAYDLTTTEFRVTNSGSHEIVLKYQGMKNVPRRFKCDGGGLAWF